jgi:hypothetical protein
MRDIEAIWFGQGSELARRMQALQHDLANRHDTGFRNAAQLIGEVLFADYNPLPDRLPELGDPPTLRPAVPRNSHPGRGIATEAGS